MQASSSLSAQIQRHYTRPDLGGAILATLGSAGKDLAALKPEDLAPIDEFHIRGREATIELGRVAGVTASQYVLDVGSGIGGPSRCLAQEFGCRVEGIDLTDEYCRVATMLAERTGLSRLVSYRQGDALDLPFSDAVFDMVWSQHVAMNIPDKARLYREMYRVLKPGGAVAIHDILAVLRARLSFPSRGHAFLERASWFRRTSSAGFSKPAGSTSPAGRRPRSRLWSGSPRWPRRSGGRARPYLAFT